MKTSNCSLDFIPTRLFRDVFETVASILMPMISRLSAGVIPAAFKLAVVQSLLDEPKLDP